MALTIMVLLILPLSHASARESKMGSSLFGSVDTSTLQNKLFQSLEDLPPPPGLDLESLRARAGKQAFKEATMIHSKSDGGGGDDSVAIGLIDALQRWADALEAQITLMRAEVVDLKSSNRRLKDELGKARLEAREMRSSAERTRNDLARTRSESERRDRESEAKVEGMRHDLKVFSKSFSDFLQHYDGTVKDVTANSTVFRKEIDWAKNTIKTLSSTIGSSDNDYASVRLSIKKMSDSITVLTQADYILEERLKGNENRTEKYASRLNSELLKLRSSVVSPGQ